MKSAKPKLLTGRHALMLAVTIATLAAVDRAEACTVGGSPSAFASGATVDCSGDTKNSSPDPTIGYGTFHDNNNTYNINAGATVKGDNFGLVLGSGGTINNSGAVTGDVGIDGTDFFTVNNISTSTSVAVISGADVGISAGELILNNTGTVEATRPSGDGISARSVDVTANSGTIRGGGHGHPIVFYRHREQFPLRPHLGQGIRHQRRNRHRHRQCRHDRSNGNGR